jgi:hypothetical protein
MLETGRKHANRTRIKCLSVYFCCEDAMFREDRCHKVICMEGCPMSYKKDRRKGRTQPENSLTTFCANGGDNWMLVLKKNS